MVRLQQWLQRPRFLPLLGNGVATRAGHQSERRLRKHVWLKYRLSIYATYSGDSNFNSATATLVVPIASLVFSPPELPNGVVGQSYSAQLLGASGGTPPYTYTLYNLSLPPGLTLNQSSGTISGKPTTYGAFEFTIQVTDSLGATALNSLEYSPSRLTSPAAFRLLGCPPASHRGHRCHLLQHLPRGQWRRGSLHLPAHIGAFPMGLNLGNRSGQLTGTPSNQRHQHVHARGNRLGNPAATVSQTYSLTIASGTLVCDYHCTFWWCCQ